MAHKILAIDLGHSLIKVARFEATFRKATLLDVESVASIVTSSGLDAVERIATQLRELRSWLADHAELGDEIALALPGDLITFRLIDLPFSDPRKIESVLRYELEAQVLAEIEELVIDYQIVTTLGAETRVLVAAASRVLLEKVIQTASEQGLTIRFIGVSPLVYGPLTQQHMELAARAKETGEDPANGSGDSGAVLVLDIGHEYTSACALRTGTAALARTLPRGGSHFTEAIAATFHLDPDKAEEAKREAGFIGHAGMQATSAGQQRMDSCLREVAKALVREVRQTIAAFRASYGEAIERIHLTGAGARLVGLAEHLSEELHLPVSSMPWPDIETWTTLSTDKRDLYAVAVGVGLSATAVTPQVNFRKGEFSFRTDYSYLRGKALYFASVLLLVLTFAALNAVASLHGLRREQEQLSTRLKQETLELFGTERIDVRAISTELKGGTKGSGGPPIPTVSAFDLLEEISRRVPPSDKIKLDVLELDIKPKKTYLKATAESAQQVDDLADGLAKIECFDEVQKGKLSTVSGPSSGDGKTSDRELKQFTLTINTTCP